MKGKWIGLSVAALVLVLVLAPEFCRESEAATKQKPAGKSGKAVTAPAPAPAFSLADTKNCTACHQAYVDSFGDPKMLASKHKTAAGDCFTCHEKADLEKKHAGATKAPGKLFRQRKYPNELCLNCHEGYEKLAEKTKNSTVFTTNDGSRSINPHNIVSLGGPHAEKTECFNCHKMHKDKPPIEFCFGCHHPRQLNNCKDCHSKKG